MAESQTTLPENILQELDETLLQTHGINPEEHAVMREILGRNPSQTELGIFSVMWSEHCSYKSSRKYLAQLPVEGDCVICGPGENAGVIDIGGDYAAIFKMESHNHPSFIEPYQGAATGVGGILRDVFTMGARPIALLNALRFGAPSHEKTPHLLNGVVAGIGGYGNCMGIPTVAGETEFDAAYNHNILVNAMCVGIAHKDKIFYSKASGVGNAVFYVGAHTGRDGIHGATMASAEFAEDTQAQKPTVQVGDPFTEKRLLEACLELMQSDAIIAIQDMGAAGLTSSSVEMAGKGGLGIMLDLDKVPQREDQMSAYELMLSESQERMLIIIKPGSENIVYDIFHKWDLEAVQIGTLSDDGNLTLMQHGKCCAHIPIDPLSSRAPAYKRPYSALPTGDNLAFAAMNAPDMPILQALTNLLQSPDLASKAWIWEQYDSYIGGNHLTTCGGNAAIIAVPENQCALAMASDSSPRYVFANPLLGGKQIVAENWRNLISVGAQPLAITNNLNFGNPEHPDIMMQFYYALEGMREACLALDYPVVSGNVSFYNETVIRGVAQAILPTPVIGGVGLIQDESKIANLALSKPNLQLYLLGETQDEFGASLYQKIIMKKSSRTISHNPPMIDLTREKHYGLFVQSLIRDEGITICHDVGQGGLLCALLRMVFAGQNQASTQNPNIGLALHAPEPELAAHAWWFSESQSRYIIAIAAEQQQHIMALSKDADCTITPLGTSTQDGMLTLEGEGDIALEPCYQMMRATLPRMAQR